MRQTALFILASAVLLATGCKKDDSVDSNPPAPANPAKEMMNVSYGSHSRQKMDVYFPAGYTASTPVVFLLHGGGLVAGSKEEFTTQATLFRDQQFVVVNMSYRLVDTTGLLSLPPQRRNSDIKIAEQLADIDSAIAAYRRAAPGWGSGSGRLYIAGHSAGAILSLLYAVGPQNGDGHIRAAANWAGVTDFTIAHDSMRNGVDPRWLELMHRAVGAEMKVANNLAYMARSAYWQAYNEGGHPVISVYPENNVIAGTGGSQLGNDYNYFRTQQFHQLLSNRSVASQLTVFPGEDHGFGTRSDSWQKVVAETAAWFKAR